MKWRFWVLGIVWSSKDCDAMERVQILIWFWFRMLDFSQSNVWVLHKTWLRIKVSWRIFKPIPWPHKTVYLCAFSGTDWWGYRMGLNVVWETQIVKPDLYRTHKLFFTKIQNLSQPHDLYCFKLFPNTQNLFYQCSKKLSPL